MYFFFFFCSLKKWIYLIKQCISGVNLLHLSSGAPSRLWLGKYRIWKNTFTAVENKFACQRARKIHMTQLQHNNHMKSLKCSHKTNLVIPCVWPWAAVPHMRCHIALGIFAINPYNTRTHFPTVGLQLNISKQPVFFTLSQEILRGLTCSKK